jgi:hypothetical protein
LRSLSGERAWRERLYSTPDAAYFNPNTKLLFAELDGQKTAKARRALAEHVGKGIFVPRNSKA